MRYGIVFLIILVVPTLLQVIALSYQQKKRHAILIRRMQELEDKIKG